MISSDGKINQNSIIIPAEYQYNNEKKAILESSVPSELDYLPLGYDNKKVRLTNETKKHYRYFIDKELENSPFLKESPFDEFTIMRGQRINKNTLLKGNNDNNGLKDVGKFKGWVEIESDTAKQFKSRNKINENKIEFNKAFMEKTLCFIRLYVLSAFSLSQMDSDSLSDPYLKIILGDQVKDTEDEYLKDKTDCDFYNFFEFKASFPGTSHIKIQVWDKDPFTSNELIGETIIDLENRFFSKKFRKLTNIPIETRALSHPLSSIQRGRIRIFLEILPILKNKAELLREPWSIKPRPPSCFQVRVIVWEVDDIPSQDIEGVSDLYVTGEFRGDKQKTDVHYRAQEGKGSFNWRMIWDAAFEKDDEDFCIKFNVWDKDFFSADDFAGECRLDFSEAAKLVMETEDQFKFIEKKEIVFQVIFLVIIKLYLFILL